MFSSGKAALKHGQGSVGVPPAEVLHRVSTSFKCATQCHLPVIATRFWSCTGWLFGLYWGPQPGLCQLELIKLYIRMHKRVCIFSLVFYMCLYDRSAQSCFSSSSTVTFSSLFLLSDFDNKHLSFVASQMKFYCLNSKFRLQTFHQIITRENW